MSSTNTAKMSKIKSRLLSSKSRWANRLAARKITEEYDYYTQTESALDPPPLPAKPTKDIGKVCIVGAGMSGM